MFWFTSKYKSIETESIIGKRKSKQDAFRHVRMIPGGGGDTSLKINMHEYKEMNLSVGNKVYLDLTKDENTGI